MEVPCGLSVSLRRLRVSTASSPPEPASLASGRTTRSAAAVNRGTKPGPVRFLGTLPLKETEAMAYDEYTRAQSPQPGTTPTHGDAGDTATLNTLIATLIDSVDGYQKAAADTDNQRFAEMFNARARERQQVITKLQAAVARLGGNPEDDGTTAGAVHRGWINLKEAVLGRDDEAIVNSVESGEDYLKEKFEAALNSGHLSGESRAAVERAYQSVRKGHDQIASIKHGLEA
jgi:uncharacterized protein (TIGR02284 family)